MKNKPNFINKIYRNKTIVSLNDKIKMLGDTKFNINRFLLFRLIFTIIIFLLVLLFVPYGLYLSLIVTILFYISFEWLFIDIPLNNRKMIINRDAILFFEELSLAYQKNSNLKESFILVCSTDDGNEIKKEINNLTYKIDKSFTNSLEEIITKLPSLSVRTTFLNILETYNHNNKLNLNKEISFLKNNYYFKKKNFLIKSIIKFLIISLILIGFISFGLIYYEKIIKLWLFLINK